VCFDVVPKMNDSTLPTSSKIVDVLVDIVGNPGATKLQQRYIGFIIPGTDC